MSYQKRVKKIIELFAYSDQMVFQETLIDRFNISKRTLQNDIAIINKILEDAGIDKITYTSSTGYSVQSKQRDFLMRKDRETNLNIDYYPLEERQLRILFLTLFNRDKIVSNTFVDYNLVTKNTALSDIKMLRRDMEEFGIDLLYNNDRGNFFVGDECRIRNYFLKKLFEGFSAKMTKTLVLMNQTLQTPIFSEQQLQANKDCFLNIERQLNIHFTDDMLEKLSIVLLVMELRQKRECYLTSSPMKKAEYISDEYSRVSKKLLSQRSNFPNDNILNYETQYLETFLICGNKTKESHSLNLELKEAVEEMISKYEELSGETFGEDRNQLLNDLLAHLFPAFFRIAYKLEWINPAIIDIKNKYKREYNLTRESVKSFEKIAGETIPENEIMYLTIIFGGYSYRKKKPIMSTVMVICPHGITRSKLIENQLKSFLPGSTIIQKSLSVREYNDKHINADIILSTVPLKATTKNFILVDKEITEEQKISILNLLNANDNAQLSDIKIADQILSLAKTHGIANSDFEQELKSILAIDSASDYTSRPIRLMDIIEKESIVFNKEKVTWKDAIKLASKPLLVKGLISENYVDAMIESIVTWGPYIIIAPGIAFPHAFPEDGVYGVGCSILCSQEPIPFSNDPKHDVRIIVVITSNDGFSHIKSLSELTYLLTFHHLSDKITEAKSSEEIYSIIDSYIETD